MQTTLKDVVSALKPPREGKISDLHGGTPGDNNVRRGRDISDNHRVITSMEHFPKQDDRRDKPELWIATGTYRTQSGEKKVISMESTRSSIHAMRELQDQFPTYVVFDHESFNELDDRDDHDV